MILIITVILVILTDELLITIRKQLFSSTPHFKVRDCSPSWC